MKRRGLFVTGTGTGVGKTEVSVRLCQLLRTQGQPVLALKPIETGVVGSPVDAERLAAACGHPEVANYEGLYRVSPPVAPWAATLAGHSDLDVAAIGRAVERAIDAFGDRNAFTIVEGAGGPLVPLTHATTVADLIATLGFPALVVSRDALGTLSHTITACESLDSRGIEVFGVVLNRFGPSDESQAFNRPILEKFISVPLFDSAGLEHLVDVLR